MCIAKNPQTRISREPLSAQRLGRVSRSQEDHQPGGVLIVEPVREMPAFDQDRAPFVAVISKDAGNAELFGPARGGDTDPVTPMQTKPFTKAFADQSEPGIPFRDEKVVRKGWLHPG